MVMGVHTVDTHALPVLGLKACLDFNLSGYSVHSSPDTSVINEFASFPLALCDRLKEELQNMEKQEIIV